MGLLLCLGYLSCFFQRYSVSEIIKSFYIALFDMIFSPFIKKVSSEFFGRDLVFQYMVTNDKYFMPDGNQSLFLTLSSHKALVFCPQMGGRFETESVTVLERYTHLLLKVFLSSLCRIIPSSTSGRYTIIFYRRYSD